MFNRKGQNTAEYAIFIALIIGAALAIQTYVKRGIQGRMKDASDDFVKAASAASWSSLRQGTTGTVTAPTFDNYKQFEPDTFHKRATQVVSEDKLDYTFDEPGKAIRATTQTTSQAQGDYEQQDYTFP